MFNIMLLRGENMIITTAMLLDELVNYRSPKTKICRMVEQGDLIPIVKGLYETDKAVSGYLIAGSIYGPSYLSFEFALSRYGLIPEAVYTFTSATFGKKKKKSYKNAFGTFTYRDVPDDAFPLDIRIEKEGDYAYWIASPEKALCDTLYAARPCHSQKELGQWIFDGLRFDENEFSKLDHESIENLADTYHCTNLKLLKNLIRRNTR